MTDVSLNPSSLHLVLFALASVNGLSQILICKVSMIKHGVYKHDYNKIIIKILYEDVTFIFFEYLQIDKTLFFLINHNHVKTEI